MSCPNTWPKPVILRAFRELIEATWTIQDLEYVQRLTEFDAMPPKRYESTLESLPILHDLKRRAL